MSDTTLPKVTIMIPTYNQATYLRHAIEGALAQDYPNLEVVVADDCSSDDTWAVVEGYIADQRLKYFRNEANIGRVRNYKKALEEYATGEWVVNCDGDDYYINNKFVSEMMQQVAIRRDIVFVQAGHQLRFANTRQQPINALPNISVEVYVYSKNDYFFNFYKLKHFSHMTTLYRRDVAIAIDFYRYDISSTDIESFLRLSLHGKVLLIKKVYGAWVQHGQNFSQRLGYEEKKKNILHITESYQYALLKVNKQQLDRWKKRALVYYFKGWLSKTARSKAFFRQKVTKVIRILQFAWSHHREVYYSFALYITLISLPYKLIQCVE